MKDAYIAAKERWAKKLGGKHTKTNPAGDRLPPGQRLVQNFPLLDLGVLPEVALAQWELRIHGPYLALPRFRDISDLHCVTTLPRR